MSRIHDFMNAKRSFLLFLIFLVVSVTAFAEKIKVKGTVKNEDDVPLSKVSVIVKGNTEGVSTDDNGNFTVEVNPKDVLVFSYNGMITRNIKVENDKFLNIMMHPGTQLRDQLAMLPPGYSMDNSNTIVFTTQVDKIIVSKETTMGTGTKESQDLKDSVDEKDKPFLNVEQMPQFPGGQRALYAFIAKNLNYPEIARKEKIQGTSVFTCVAERSGALSNFKLVRAIGGRCDDEAYRILKLMPQWIPGKQNGKVVRVLVIIPVPFYFEDSIAN